MPLAGLSAPKGGSLCHHSRSLSNTTSYSYSLLTSLLCLLFKDISLLSYVGSECSLQLGCTLRAFTHWRHAHSLFRSNGLVTRCSIGFFQDFTPFVGLLFALEAERKRQKIYTSEPSHLEISIEQLLLHYMYIDSEIMQQNYAVKNLLIIMVKVRVVWNQKFMKFSLLINY